MHNFCNQSCRGLWLYNQELTGKIFNSCSSCSSQVRRGHDCPWILSTPENVSQTYQDLVCFDTLLYTFYIVVQSLPRYCNNTLEWKCCFSWYTSCNWYALGPRETQAKFAHHLGQTIYLFRKTSSKRFVFGRTCKETNYSMEIRKMYLDIPPFFNITLLACILLNIVTNNYK